MADRELRHRRGPSLHIRKHWLRRNGEQRRKFLARRREHRVVPKAHHLALQRAAEKNPRETHSLRRAPRKLQTRKASRDYFPMLRGGHDEPKTSRDLRKVRRVKRHVDGGCRCVIYATQQRRERRIVRPNQRCSRVARRGTHDGVGLERRAIRNGNGPCARVIGCAAIISRERNNLGTVADTSFQSRRERICKRAHPALETQKEAPARAAHTARLRAARPRRRPEPADNAAVSPLHFDETRHRRADAEPRRRGISGSIMMRSLPHGLNNRLLSSGPKAVGASSENPSGISTSRPARTT